MTFKLLDFNLNNELKANAKKNERLRYHLNLHGSYNEPVQRIIISLMRGTYIPPHYHEFKYQWEYFNVISGNICVIIFDQNGTVIEKFKLGQNTGAYGVEFSSNTIHTILCESEHSIILELKEGPFIPSKAKVIPSWAPDEQYCTYSRAEIVSVLEKIKPGQNLPEALLEQEL
ncbi:WbuC family cupin fold metalloprotein [Escherichia coli]|uniref:WbuC family cupin fold metalloprotein n=1 Tax=Escherichia coli TaxID=562 RepID=UPI00068CB24F|nr:WbuC family cupin fold metalloprotein [Escherichia coli]EFN6745189.1 cupin fold metalloprotein, WbuC family [Escherichia coli O6]EFX7252901.1 WbuC family cupin fold metalloprotein [Shigella sonnei]EEW3683869.1 cupin fold metalloprotein, WbuC family [Escherichia coli]EFH3338551.1 cupin fold metalloprotein, WbuC family [Escherichia coli]EFI3423324.1 WbuC family cupin fold metalloprotein [Escherichia coli]